MPITKKDLLEMMQVCVDNQDTSWFYEWNLIDLHDAIHELYDRNDTEKKWFNAHSEAHRA